MNTKKLLCLLLVLALTLGLCACSANGEPEKATDDVPPAERPAPSADAAQPDAASETPAEPAQPQDAAPTEQAPEEALTQFYFDESDRLHFRNLDGAVTPDYSSVFDPYLAAVSEKWSFGQIMEAELSELIADLPENGFEYVGRMDVDLDGDGVCEMLIGSLDEAQPSMIYDAYTFVDGAPVRLFLGQSRDRWYFAFDPETETVILQNEGSMSAFESLWQTAVVENGALKTMQVLHFNSNDADVWTLTEGDGAPEVLEEDAANALIASWEAQRVLPAFASFGFY